MYTSENLQEFWLKTRPVNGCLEWLGPAYKTKTRNNGYAFLDGKKVSATHLAWHLVGKTLNEGDRLRHSCNAKFYCVNPDHLYPDNLVSRFNRFVLKTRYCHLWLGAKSSDGYGELKVDGKIRGAHRVAYELAYGTIPVNNSVLHHCHNPQCVNPDHLHLGTHKENMAEKARAGRACRGEQQKNAKLSEVKVLTILSEAGAGTTTAKDLAKRFEVSVTCVKAVIARKTWKHVKTLTVLGATALTGQSASIGGD